MLRYLMVFLLSFLSPLFLLQRFVPLRRPPVGAQASIPLKKVVCPPAPRQQTVVRPWDAEASLAELDAAIRSLLELPPDQPEPITKIKEAVVEVGLDGEVLGAKSDAPQYLSRKEVEALLATRKCNSTWETDRRGEFVRNMVEKEVKELYDHVKSEVEEILEAEKIEKAAVAKEEGSRQRECVKIEVLDEIILSIKEKLSNEEQIYE